MKSTVNLGGWKLPWDNELPYSAPTPPPRRLCPICGRKYEKISGKGSPCGHVQEDDTIIIEAPRKVTSPKSQD